MPGRRSSLGIFRKFVRCSLGDFIPALRPPFRPLSPCFVPSRLHVSRCEGINAPNFCAVRNSAITSQANRYVEGTIELSSSGPAKIAKMATVGFLVSEIGIVNGFRSRGAFISVMEADLGGAGQQLAASVDRLESRSIIRRSRETLHRAAR
jgi:hypothetical protein